MTTTEYHQKAPNRCQGCPRIWTGLAEAHCSECHRHFTSVKPFDIHRDQFRCIDPVRLRRLFPTQRHDGMVWASK